MVTIFVGLIDLYGYNCPLGCNFFNGNKEKWIVYPKNKKKWRSG